MNINKTIKAERIIKELKLKSNLERKNILQRFFKTGKGEYGEGDIFLGVTVPEIRKIAKKYSSISFIEINKILKTRIHEQRLVALLILVEKYDKSNQKQKEIIFNFYIKNTKYINNWDLIDVTAPKIIGDYIFHNSNKKRILYEFAKSNNLWKKRISIISTYYFIKNQRYNETLIISKILLFDKHDLIHKAVGWMLREVGKQEQKILEIFLKEYFHNMPRTMLRYAIEKFPEKKQKYYLRK
ncbi:MAG: DNA alkylation repair protein [Candidatus Woesearchaeota archaeon]